MNSPLQPELTCPRCRIEVQPIKAAVHWYCPHCVWQFSDDEVWRAQHRPPKDSPPQPSEGDADKS